eukprot:1159336-Pelagomonas_calceolata.AAC.3
MGARSWQRLKIDHQERFNVGASPWQHLKLMQGLPANRRREQTQAHAAASLPEGPGKQCKQGLLAHACHSVPFWRAAAAATAQACALARA